MVATCWFEISLSQQERLLFGINRISIARLCDAVEKSDRKTIKLKEPSVLPTNGFLLQRFLLVLHG